MFDIGWTELMVIGVVALIVVGPKDLPKMFRTLGQFTAKARAMAREFQHAMDDAADASGVKDVARDLRKATDAKGMGLDEFNKMRNWDPLRDDAATASKNRTKGTQSASLPDEKARTSGDTLDAAIPEPSPASAPRANQASPDKSKA